MYNIRRGSTTSLPRAPGGSFLLDLPSDDKIYEAVSDSGADFSENTNPGCSISTNRLRQTKI